MNWVLEHLQIIIGAAAAIAYLLNRSRQTQRDEEMPRGDDQTDSEQAERTRRVQEDIRRKIAERRAVASETAEREPVREPMPPLVRPSHVPPIDPFGGPMRRILKEIEQAAEKRFEAPPPEEAVTATAEIERQERLAEQMRALEVARLAEQRRAAQISAVKKVERARTARVWAGEAQGDFGAQLRDRAQLRRAFVLREVLGPPVSLR